MSPCWTSLKSNLVMQDATLSKLQRCGLLRFRAVLDAKAACETNRWCGGVSRDNGLVCNGASLRYELRSGRLVTATTGSGKRTNVIQSWVLNTNCTSRRGRTGSSPRIGSSRGDSAASARTRLWQWVGARARALHDSSPAFRGTRACNHSTNYSHPGADYVVRDSEFGYELYQQLPTVYRLCQAGQLRSLSICAGRYPLYYFMPRASVSERTDCHGDDGWVQAANVRIQHRFDPQLTFPPCAPRCW